MATGSVSVTNTFVNNTTADGPQVSQNFTDILNWLNNRDDGTDEWQVLKVTATTANPVIFTSDQATTTVSISNSATDGDPVLSFELGGTAVVTMGIDDGDSDKFKIGSTAIGTSTVVEIIPTAAPHFKVISDDATTQLYIDNTAADGDPILTFGLSGTAKWSLGVDDSDSDLLKLSTGGSLASPFIFFQGGSPYLKIASSDPTTVVTVENSAADGDPGIELITTTGSTRSIWIDDSDSDKLILGVGAVAGSVGWAMDGSGNITPGGNKTQDHGNAGTAWDDIYADDFQNVADIPFLDMYYDEAKKEWVEVNDLDIIKGIKPAKDGEGKLIVSKGKFAMWDDYSLPDFLFTVDKKDNTTILKDPDGKPFIAVSALAGLALGGVKQLEAIVDQIKKDVDILKGS